MPEVPETINVVLISAVREEQVARVRAIAPDRIKVDVLLPADVALDGGVVQPADRNPQLSGTGDEASNCPPHCDIGSPPPASRRTA